MAVRMRHHLGSIVGELRWEPVPTRVRAFVRGHCVVDSTAALVAWEPRRIVPVYAAPEAGFAYGVTPADPQPAPPDPATLPPLLGPPDFATHTCPGTVLDVHTHDGVLPGAGFRPDDADLGGAVLLDFSAFDAWQVEDEPRIAHPHDPFKRISVHASTRHVEVGLAESMLASSHRALMLVETHLPPRWYVPSEDVRMDMLVPSATTSECAYKGVASYLSLPGIADDIGWFYAEPLDDARRVRDHVCFWSERSDLWLDGEPQQRPITPWSTPEEQRTAAPERLEFG